MKVLQSLFCLVVLPLSCSCQLISISSGFYNQVSTTVEPMINQTGHNEEDSFYHLDVDNIYSYKGFEFGASYSYMRTGISIFVDDSSFGLAGEGTLEANSHRIGIKFSYPIQFWNRCRLSPYALASYELTDPNESSYEISYGKFNSNKFTFVNVNTEIFEVSQFMPSLGAQLNVRAFRQFNVVFNLQYSFGSKVVSYLQANYRYFDDQYSAAIQNTNTGIMMGFGIGYDLDYRHKKKSKKE